jgi:hypothetical protein
MAEYIAHTDLWLSHECRLVKAGEKFTTNFPKAKVDGKEVEMRLSDNLELVKPTKGKKPDGDEPLV